jgi:hypothetical protein
VCDYMNEDTVKDLETTLEKVKKNYSAKYPEQASKQSSTVRRPPTKK